MVSVYLHPTAQECAEGRRDMVMGVVRAWCHISCKHPIYDATVLPRRCFSHPPNFPASTDSKCRGYLHLGPGQELQGLNSCTMSTLAQDIGNPAGEQMCLKAGPPMIFPPQSAGVVSPDKIPLPVLLWSHVHLWCVHLLCALKPSSPS